ncbi:MAG: energy-coupled thiamine transporter ThiT [Erysipelotrichaceae bacterium]|nr:energy-coupled thiamine transporter ThiT [Erysipelotrichaceae bacterium]MBQ1521676.1 energy-coupled thiamine transporter ThiT [Erysipelotrichaceae bacterium]
MKNNSTRDIVYMALYAALFVALDFVTNTFNLLPMPQGGHLGLGTIALILASYHLGWKKGAVVCLASNLLMYITGSMNFYGSVISLFFDYIIAYTAYGFSSCFPNIKYFYSGIIITSLIRLACSTYSGIAAFGSPFMASLSYNAGYIIPTMIVDAIIVPLLYERLKPIVKK